MNAFIFASKFSFCNEKPLEVLGVRNVALKIAEGVPKHGASSRSQGDIGKAHGTGRLRT